jgi:tetratricopeptide (TPR) repeat protein
LTLLTSPFTSREVWKRKRTLYFAWEALDRIQQKEYPDAIDWARRGLGEYPGDNSIRSVLGLAQLGAEDFPAARETLVECLAACGEDLQQRALSLNNVAWCDLFLDAPLWLDEAESYSAEAFRIAPWLAPIRGTRGMVLVECGELDEGIDLLKKALAGNRDARSRATNACCLAIAFARKRELDESRRHLAKARKLDANCSLIARAEKELGALEVGV